MIGLQILEHGLEAEPLAHLVRLPSLVQADEALVDQILALGHSFGVVHVVSLPVAQLRILTSLVQVRGLPDHELAHLVHEEALAAREQSEYRRRLQALPVDELAQVKLLVQRRLRFDQHLLVVSLTAEGRTKAVLSANHFHALKILSYAIDDVFALFDRGFHV